MFDNFVKLGNVELDPSDIFMVVWEWKQGTITLLSGLTDFGDTDELLAVGIMFRSGGNVKIEGNEAKLFREWWIAMTAPIGDIA